MVKKTPPAARQVVTAGDEQPEEKPTVFTEEFIQSHAMVDEGTWMLVDMSPSNDWCKTELRNKKINPCDTYQHLGNRLLDKYKILYGAVKQIHVVVEIAKYTGRVHTHANIQIGDPYDFHQRIMLLRLKNEFNIRIDVDTINDIDGRKRYLEKDSGKTEIFKQVYWQNKDVTKRKLYDSEQSEDD